jgi:hypothetical protein
VLSASETMRATLLSETAAGKLDHRGFLIRIRFAPREDRDRVRPDAKRPDRIAARLAIAVLPEIREGIAEGQAVAD